MVTVVSERELESFRRDHLAPGPLLQLIERRVAALARVAVGVGKSRAADSLLQHDALFSRFDCVLYAAPSWDILNERDIVAGRVPSIVRHLVVEPRPRERCGELDAVWHDLELRGCGTLAKRVVCDGCKHRATCTWPDQFRHIKGTQLVFTTEQQLLLNRAFVLMIAARTEGKRVLVILDEARLLDAQFEVRLAFDNIRRFAEVVDDLARRRALSSNTRRDVRALVDALRSGSLRRLPTGSGNLARSLNRDAFKIQERGVESYSDAFRYLGYDLAQIVYSRPHERWRDDDGVRFIARPYLSCHVLVLSAHLSQHYVGHRLGRTAIESPFEHHRFLHSGTRIFNIRSRTGADSYFLKNHRSILDTFALLVASNIEAGRTTVLVSRKKHKQFCADHIAKRLAGWGYEIRIVTDAYDELPTLPDPRVVPMIHYGVLGVNDFTDYESVYCLNSYYVSSRALSDHVQEYDAKSFRVELEIISGPQRRRRVRVAQPCAARRALESLGNDYLRRLELDPVIQAAGRVRFATKPREVVLFQMADLRSELPDCVDVGTPTVLRAALALPDPATIDHRLLGSRARALMAAGGTADEAAAELGISRRSLFRHVRTVESAKSPLRESICRRFGTPPSADGGTP